MTDHCHECGVPVDHDPECRCPEDCVHADDAIILAEKLEKLTESLRSLVTALSEDDKAISCRTAARMVLGAMRRVGIEKTGGDRD